MTVRFLVSHTPQGNFICKKALDVGALKDDLWFAMKGAGTSFGITTEFKYKVYEKPETKPAVFLAYIHGPSDFKKIESVVEAGRFQVTGFKYSFFRKPDLVCLF